MVIFLFSSIIVTQPNLKHYLLFLILSTIFVNVQLLITVILFYVYKHFKVKLFTILNSVVSCNQYKFQLFSYYTN